MSYENIIRESLLYLARLIIIELRFFGY